VCLMAIVPPLIQTDGLAKDVGATTSMGQWLMASLLTLPFMGPLGIMIPLPVSVAMIAALIFALWFRPFLMRHLGGVTGDCLGFGVYVGQILILLAATATVP